MKWGRDFGTSWGKGVYTGFWWVNMKEREQLEVLGADGKSLLKYVLNK